MNFAPFLGNIDSNAIEQMYQQYKQDPASVDLPWQKFFEGFELGQSGAQGGHEGGTTDANSMMIRKEKAVSELIAEYRNRGHLFAKTNPIRARRRYSPTITLDRFGLAQEDLNTKFHAGESIQVGYATLQEIIDTLNATYQGTIGCEYNNIQDPLAVDWLRQAIEKNQNRPSFSKDQKLRILKSLCHAVTFEQFIHSRFIGQKRFSLEGIESLIPALAAVIDKGAESGVKEYILGMAHRGRLNVLANVFQKDFHVIFSEFESKGYEDKKFTGDVKYHLGYSINVESISGKEVHLNLIPNPSHLETVNPVVAGVTRAKLDRRYDGNEDSIVPILIHGDASISGQGIIYELIQMSNLPGYSFGGTVHIVANNQLGFTTNYQEGRSSTYCTDIAKITHSPVFHVNADDIEAVVHTAIMAIEFRQKFKRDVFIDILGYRKYGHNEGDDPSLTQPILYSKIKDHPNVFEIYSNQLIAAGVCTQADSDKLKEEFWQLLESQLEKSKGNKKTPLTSFLKGDWSNIKIFDDASKEKQIKTGISLKALKEIVTSTTQLPEDTPFIKKIMAIQNGRRTDALEKNKVDWANAETIAFGSLLLEKYNLRFSGQDILRGTFSQRHIMFRSENELLDYFPLRNLSKEQGRFSAYNSLLSEYAVLGFEYGYAFASPDTLTLWEAQFGDFANGAQIIIDQFIASSETKWQRMSGIVLLLPHGQEGQGPEHSSARIERFLQLAAEDNMFVANVSTPANYFHVLRRHLKVEYRKPLVLFTPKSLLRHPDCVSTLDDMAEGTYFKLIIDDEQADPKNVDHLIICSGKIYYELNKYRLEHKIKNFAILRLEQFHPFPTETLLKTIKAYGKINDITWVQEEPENQGPLQFIEWNWPTELPELKYISRPEFASTASGFSKRFHEEQDEIITRAFEAAAKKK